MAVALSDTYAQPAVTTDIWVVVALGGGTTPVILNTRTGTTISVDEAALTGTTFTLINVGLVTNPKFAQGDILSIAGSSCPFLVAEVSAFQASAGGFDGNAYIGWFLQPGSQAASAGTPLPNGLTIQVVAEALVTAKVGTGVI